MLRLNAVCKQFAGKTIFEKVSATVEAGQLLLLKGPSGCGKTTLLRAIAGLETLDGGNIEYNGKLGMVQQDYQLFPHLSVRDNLVVPLRKILNYSAEQAWHKAEVLLHQYGIRAEADQFPNQLSGGQKQRLAIARTKAMKPQWILFDEPTSALDPARTQQIANSIRQLLVDNIGIVLTTHDSKLIDQLPEATVLSLGSD